MQNMPIRGDVTFVTPRKRRVSRNKLGYGGTKSEMVTPRKRRVSRNYGKHIAYTLAIRHASQEACE